ncbi:EamA family transporter [candidate division KSB1 bacterium]|nr:EamA family transporter [candidate division KSB1 bacterium]
MSQQSQIKLIAAFAAIYFIWGSTYLAIKYALEAIPPFIMMGTRSLAAGLILYLWSHTRGDEKVKKENVIPIVIIGILFFLVGHGLLAWGQQRIASGFAALLVASEPLCIAVIEAFLVRDDKAASRTIIGLICGFLGISILLAPGQELGAHDVDFLSAFAILLGTLSWSLGAVYSRVAKLPKAPALAAGLELLVGGFLLVICGLFMGEGSRLQIDALSLRSILGLVYLIVFGSVVAFTAYVWLLSFTSATRVATHTYVNPVIAVFLGWAVAGEPMSLQTFVATIIIVISVYLVLGKKREISPRLDTRFIRNAEA